MLYRIHDKLLIDHKASLFIDRGCVNALATLGSGTIKALLKSGAISEVHAPPLGTFWGDTGRTRKLVDLGIDTIGFVSMDAHDVAYAIRASVRQEAEEQEDFDRKVDQLALAVERWQSEIKDYLGIGNAYERR